tara:strand:- start:337 stop:606 length:270 start_codon:yes stop_codon:yes gene_type:complete
MKNFLKEKNYFKIIKIFFIFAVTGSLSLFISKFFFGLYNFNIIFKTILLVIIYQILLLFISLLFGEIKYFSKLPKKLLYKTNILKKNKF